eukprot:g6251.t1
MGKIYEGPEGLWAKAPVALRTRSHKRKLDKNLAELKARREEYARRTQAKNEEYIKYMLERGGRPPSTWGAGSEERIKAIAAWLEEHRTHISMYYDTLQDFIEIIDELPAALTRDFIHIDMGVGQHVVALQADDDVEAE